MNKLQTTSDGGQKLKIKEVNTENLTGVIMEKHPSIMPQRLIKA